MFNLYQYNSRLEVVDAVRYFDGGRAYEVEFVSLDGATSIVPHARKLAYA